MTATVQQLADAICVDPGDVRVTVATLVDLHDDELPDWVITEVDAILNPWRIRTVPEIWSSATLRTDGRCTCRALGGLEHTAGPDCPEPPR